MKPKKAASWGPSGFIRTPPPEKPAPPAPSTKHEEALNNLFKRAEHAILAEPAQPQTGAREWLEREGFYDGEVRLRKGQLIVSYTTSAVMEAYSQAENAALRADLDTATLNWKLSLDERDELRAERDRLREQVDNIVEWSKDAGEYEYIMQVLRDGRETR